MAPIVNLFDYSNQEGKIGYTIVDPNTCERLDSGVLCHDHTHIPSALNELNTLSQYAQFSIRSPNEGSQRSPLSASNLEAIAKETNALNGKKCEVIRFSQPAPTQVEEYQDQVPS
jgi:hypothetical protein